MFGWLKRQRDESPRQGPDGGVAFPVTSELSQSKEEQEDDNSILLTNNDISDCRDGRTSPTKSVSNQQYPFSQIEDVEGTDVNTLWEMLYPNKEEDVADSKADNDIFEELLNQCDGNTITNSLCRVKVDDENPTFKKVDDDYLRVGKARTEKTMDDKARIHQTGSVNASLLVGQTTPTPIKYKDVDGPGSVEFSHYDDTNLDAYLNDVDDLWDSVRDLHTGSLGPKLSQKDGVLHEASNYKPYQEDWVDSDCRQSESGKLVFNKQKLAENPINKKSDVWDDFDWLVADDQSYTDEYQDRPWNAVGSHRSSVLPPRPRAAISPRADHSLSLPNQIIRTPDSPLLGVCRGDSIGSGLSADGDDEELNDSQDGDSGCVRLHRVANSTDLRDPLSDVVQQCDVNDADVAGCRNPRNPATDYEDSIDMLLKRVLGRKRLALY